MKILRLMQSSNNSNQIRFWGKSITLTLFPERNFPTSEEKSLVEFQRNAKMNKIRIENDNPLSFCTKKTVYMNSD